MSATPSLRTLVAASVMAAALASTTTARAGGYGMIDLDTCFPTDQSGSIVALGAGLRAGWQFDVGPAWIGPEIGGSFTGYLGGGGEDASPFRRALNGERLLGGVRFGLRGPVRPSVYARLGLGWIGGGTPGPAFDGGAAVDFALVPLFVFGAHAGYNMISVWHSAQSGGPVLPLSATLGVLRWMSLGLHAGVGF